MFFSNLKQVKLISGSNDWYRQSDIFNKSSEKFEERQEDKFYGICNANQLDDLGNADDISIFSHKMSFMKDMAIEAFKLNIFYSRHIQKL